MAALDHKELQNELKNKRICRFCLSIDPISLTNILFRDSHIKSSAPLPIQVMAIASIEIFSNDGMPPYACSDCISMFEYSYQFKQMCKKADNLLRQYPFVGKWPKSLEKPTMPKALLTKFLLEQNNTTLQTKQNVTQESLLLPKKTLNVDAEGKGKANNNVTNSQQYVPKVEKGDDECNITYLEKINNNDDLSMDDIQMLVAADEAESAEMENLNLNKDASRENKPRLSLPMIKKSEDGNMEKVQEILNIDDNYEEEPNPTNSEPIESNIFPCPHCERSFSLAQLRQIHINQHHRVRQFPCNKCGKSFFYKHHLVKHLFIHEDEKPFKCSACDKGFNRAVYFSRHLKTHKDIPTHTCVHCDMTFLSKEDMDKHVEKHNRHRPFKCKVCDKRFVLKLGLVKHEVVHSNLQPCHCQYCDQSFPNASKLTRHLIVHAGYRPFSCKYCKKTFLQLQHLKQHLRSHRNTNNVDFICPTCKTCFKTRDQLIQHSKTHSNEQNLTCSLCKETFINMKTLTTHVQGHSEGEAYACEFCDLIFIAAEKLQLHINFDHISEMELYRADDRAQADKKKINSTKDEIDLSETSLQSTDNAFIMGELTDGGGNVNNQLKRKIKSEQEILPNQIIIQNETEQKKIDEIENQDDEIDLSEESLQSTVNAFLMGESSDGRENVNQLKRKIKTEQETSPKIVNQIIIQNATEQTNINVIGNQVNDKDSLLIPLKQCKINATEEMFTTAKEKKEQQNKQSPQLEREVVNTATPTRDVNQLTRQSLLKIQEKTSNSIEQKTLLDKVKEDASPSPSSTNAVEYRSEAKITEKRAKVQKIRVTKAEAAAMVRDGHVKIKDGKIILKRKSAKTIV